MLSILRLFCLKMTAAGSSETLKISTKDNDQARGLVVRFSDHGSCGYGFDSRFCHGDFSLKEKIPMGSLI
jgi:hypothetical protein